jgi:RNA polymerase sigma-70 factor (sigma-E family)
MRAPSHLPRPTTSSQPPGWFGTFDEFVVARGESLVRRARVLLPYPHLAEDCVAEVLGKVWLRWTQISRADQPEAYVWRMLINQCNSMWRRSSVRREVAVDAREMPDRAVADSSVEHASRSVMMRALRQLSPRQRSVLVLRHYEALSDGEIAAIMRISEKTVRYHASVAGRNLERILRTDEGTTS